MSVETTEVIMPQMGESITEATITGWRKEVGDEVTEGEALLDISTAKVEVEIPSPFSGVLAEIIHAKDDTVPIDTVIAKIAPKGADISGIKSTPKKETTEVEAAAEAPTPELVKAVSSNGGTNGVSLDSEGVERERQHLIKRRSTPLVRNIARDLNIDLNDVEGSGVHGRVTKRDIEAYIEMRKDLADSQHGVSGDDLAQPEPERGGRIKLDTVSGPSQAQVFMQPDETPISQMRRDIAAHMVKSTQTIPHAYTVHEVDFTRLEKLRVRQKQIFEKQFNTRLTPLVFILKAVTEALIKHPKINASWRGDKIVQHKHVNLGVAVAVPAGLVVPVVKHVESMSLAGIARGVVDLASRGRDNKLKPSDMEGGTFTITSPGKLGATMGIPIINNPQGAILHVGAIQKVPAVVTGPEGEDVIAIRYRAMLTLGLDHRLIDGWDADQFMADLKDLIQRAEFGLTN